MDIRKRLCIVMHNIQKVLKGVGKMSLPFLSPNTWFSQGNALPVSWVIVKSLHKRDQEL